MLFNFPASSYFVYLQLRSALRAYGVSWGSTQPSPLTRLDKTFGQSMGQSIVYLQKLVDHHIKQLAVEQLWKRELSSTGPSLDWNTIWANLSDTSKNLAHLFIHYKIIHRAYATPYRRYQMKHIFVVIPVIFVTLHLVHLCICSGNVLK